MRHPRSPIFEHHPTPTDTSSAHHPVKMRTYDDSFSGQKIYPGKVRSITPSGPNLQEEEVVLCGFDDDTTFGFFTPRSTTTRGCFGLRLLRGLLCDLVSSSVC